MQGMDHEVSRADPSIPTASDAAIDQANRSAQNDPINRARTAHMHVRSGRAGGARFSQELGNAAGVHGNERFALRTKGNPAGRLHADTIATCIARRRATLWNCANCRKLEARCLGVG